MMIAPLALLGMYLLPVLSVFGIWLCWLWLLPSADIPSFTRSM